MRQPKRFEMPVPEFVTADIDNRTTVYAWKCEGYGLTVLGNTKREAMEDFITTCRFEYGWKF